MNEELILKLRDVLYREFNEAELAKLAKDLGLDLALLSGEGHFGKSRAVVMALADQGNLLVLRNRLRDLRPVAFAAVGLDKFSDTAVSAAKVGGSLPIGRLVALLVGLLLIVLLCVFVLFPNNRNAVVQPAAGTVTPVTTETTAEVVIATTTASQPQPTLPPELTSVSPVAATPTLLPTEAPAATATATVSETHPAALRIPELNVQLIDFYQGKIKETDLRYWRGGALSGVLSFSKNTLLKILRLTEADRSKIQTTLRYIKRPSLTSQVGNTFTVDSQEYWSYKANAIQVCETRNYRYILVKDGQTFALTAVTGQLVNNKCL